MNQNFLHNTFEHFLSCCRSRKLILFGDMPDLGNRLSELDGHGLDIAYIVDNDFRKHYTVHYGIKVLPPCTLLRENPSKIVVLIMTRRPYQIKEQLEDMGEYTYFSSVLFLDQYIEKRAGTLFL